MRIGQKSVIFLYLGIVEAIELFQDAVSDRNEREWGKAIIESNNKRIGIHPLACERHESDEISWIHHLCRVKGDILQIFIKCRFGISF